MKGQIACFNMKCKNNNKYQIEYFRLWLYPKIFQMILVSCILEQKRQNLWDLLYTLTLKNESGHTYIFVSQ